MSLWCTTWSRTTWPTSRQGTQSALTRAEVSGGGHQALASEGHRPRPSGQHPRPPVDPRRHRVCPQAPRSYSYTLNKKVKRLALKSVLSAKAADGRTSWSSTPSRWTQPKTKEFAKFLQAVGLPKARLWSSPPQHDQNWWSSPPATSPAARSPSPTCINVYDILNANKLVVDKAALAKIEEVFA